MKLENCTTYAPGFDYCYANVDNCIVEEDYECVIKQNTDDAFSPGSDGNVAYCVQTLYKSKCM